MTAALVMTARILVFALGSTIVLWTLRSIIRTFVLPRNIRAKIAWTLFRILRQTFHVLMLFTRTYEQRDALLAMYAPVSLLMLPLVWLAFILLGFTGIFWALEATSFQQALILSGSSLFTLGFAALPSLGVTIFAFIEAALGLILVALFIGYLPTMYNAWSRREATVSLLEVRAGSPPSAVEMLLRYRRIGQLGTMAPLWLTWEQWFTELGETHTTLAALSLFRSSSPHRSWVTASGTIMDAAALMLSAIDLPRNTEAGMCVRAGAIALRGIAESLAAPYNPDPQKTHAISVTRQEFDDALARLAAADIPLHEDRDQAWREFAEWRVHYDFTLLSLARMLMAPEAPWTADRRPTPYDPSLKLERVRSRA
ncbi:MAG TPA: hypothetical protein VFN78_07955 [Ktedonobacterales bacterium]|nr:hypothetical protein [Ktedonobacterales bacterium]